jgi:ABC-2 type transport system ATP-binding protein
MMNPVIAIESLSKRYGRLSVLERLSLEVDEGSVFGLIGSNGAGKTTTIKILMNILKADSGECRVLGVPSNRLGPAELEKIGYVSENQQMPGWMTVDYLLQYLKPFYPTWDSGYARELVEHFKLPRNRKLSQLSRGMWMKTALLSALAYHPRLLVLDEPFSGLDPLVREDLIQGLIDSANETTLFISSHDLADIESFATHIAFLSEGNLQFSEEMTSLRSRFREVEVLVNSPVMLCDCPDWPQNWIRPEASPVLVRFVETCFEPERTNGQIHEVFGNVQQVSTNPMSLRDIFITLARSRDGAARVANG